MKKFTLLALAIMASATSFAQTTLWNGEDKELNTDGGMWADRCSPKVVVNPDKNNDVNKSEKCLQFTINGNEPDWKNRAIAWGLGENNGIYQDRVLSLKIRKVNAGNVKIDLECSDGSHVYTAKWYDGGDKWQKLYFAFPNDKLFNNPKAITIFANNDAEGEQVVYIDDIMLEAQPMVDGKVLSAQEVKDISGNVKLTGTWLKFDCVNPTNWKTITYDNYQDFNNKSTNTLTSVDIREAQASDVDINQFFKNPNTLVYTNEYYEHNNIIVNGKAKSVALIDDNPFSCFEAFDAAKVSLTRTVREGINSFVLPFNTTAGDLEAEHVATFKSATDDKVTFATTDHVDANIPFITIGLKNAAENKEFTFFGNEKRFEVTPTKSTESTPAFKGVYAPQSAKGLYGITDKGELQKGAAGTTINSFHAFYQAAEGQTAPAKISFEGEATGINNVAAATVANGAVYDLSGRRVAEKLAGASLVKGIYVVNGKKVVVK